MNDAWDAVGAVDRHDLIKEGVLSLFLGKNRTLTEKTAGDKASMLSEKLKGLPDDKIAVFFRDAEDSFENLPSDGQLRKYLSVNFARYSGAPKQNNMLPASGGLTQDDINFFNAMSAKHPDFKDLFDETISRNTNYPGQDWNRRFYKRIGEVIFGGGRK